METMSAHMATMETMETIETIEMMVTHMDLDSTNRPLRGGPRCQPESTRVKLSQAEHQRR